MRVAIAGAGLANHAELNVVPGSLAAKVPDDVPAEHAAFGTIGAIALHAVRNLGLGIGDIAAVVGVGLIGQLACQFLNLSGIRVLALDYNTGRLQLARDLGAEAARDLQFALARRDGHLGGEQLSADLGECETGAHADAVLLLRLARMSLEELPDQLGRRYGLRATARPAVVSTFDAVEGDLCPVG